MVTAYKFSQKLILSAVLFAVIAILSSSISFAQCTYCTASTSYEDEYISRFVCGDIDNSTDWQSGVADYTSKSTDMKAGSDYSAKVYNPSPYSSDQVRVFIDWNKDCDFDDSGETYTLSTSDGGSTFTGTISAPMSMAGGATRMRVRMTYSSTPSACGSSSYGEVEDYTVNAILPAPDAGVAAIIPPTAPYVEGKYTVKMTLGSYGDDDVGSCTIHWSVNSVEQTPYYWTGKLKKGNTADVTLGSYAFIYPPEGPFDPFKIRVWLTDIKGALSTNPDNNPGNDEKTIQTKPSTEDAQPILIVQPSGDILPGMHDIVVRVRNNARKPLTTLSIDWYVDGTKQGTKNWLGYLAQYQTADVTVGSYNFQFKTPLSPYTIKAVTVNPNSIPDPVPGNDTLNQNVAPSLVPSTFTIGGSNAHFPDITTAITYLNASGIIGDGDVIFNLNSGTYKEQLQIKDFAHGNNHFYFQSATGYASDVILTSSPTIMNNYIFGIDGLDNITFRNLTFIANDGGAGTIINASGSDNMTFENVIFNGVAKAPVSDNYSLIRTEDGNNLNFNNCQFNYGSDGININTWSATANLTIKNSTFKDYTGMGSYVNTSLPEKVENQKSKDNKILNGGPSIIIDGNTFSGSNYSPYGGIYIAAPAQITNNTFSGFTRNMSVPNYQGAIILEHNETGTLSTIANNTINNMNSVSGISIVANDVKIENNQIGVLTSNDLADGVYLQGSNIIMNYNKVNVTTTAGAGAAIQASNADGIIANNLFVNLGGQALYAESNNNMQFYYNTYVSNTSNSGAYFSKGTNTFKRNLVINYGQGKSANIDNSTVVSQENAIYTKGATNAQDLTNWKNKTGDNMTTNVAIELTDDGTYKLTKFFESILSYTSLGIPSEYEQYDYYGLERSGYYYAGFAGIRLDITILKQPESILACNGEINKEIRVSASISYGAPIKFQWQKDGVDIPGATAPILRFPTFDYTTTGTYRVRIYGPANTAEGTYSDEVLVYTLRPTEIVKQPQDMEANLGGTVQFSVEAHTKGITPPYFQHRYQWYRVINGIETQLMDNEHYANTTSPIMTITNLQDLHFSGENDYYFVEVEGQCGTIRSNNVRLNMITPTLSFDKQPENVEICWGHDVTFTAEAISQVDELISYQWYYNGAVINDGAKYSGTQTNTLTVYTVVESDTGKYKVLAIGQISGAKRYSNEATINLNRAAMFTTNPPETLTLQEGETLTLSVVATGTEPMTYQWYYNDVAIEGQTTPTLVIENVTPANNSGFYRCEATNVCGSSSSTACQVQVEPTGGITGISDGSEIGLEVKPNPVGSELRIELVGVSEGFAEIIISDMTGRAVLTAEEAITAGTNNLRYNVSNLATGTYFISIHQNGNIYAKQIAIVK
jgi:hypothetical protein